MKNIILRQSAESNAFDFVMSCVSEEEARRVATEMRRFELSTCPVQNHSWANQFFIASLERVA